MDKCEILAPVGGAEQLLAAVRCGADAVYLGTKGFNARQNAENFDCESLGKAVSYCHARGVKLYVTINTLVMDSEFDKLKDEAEMIADSGADAVIIQDMAVFKLFRDCCPTLKRHASTQTVVHNADGAKFLRDIGYDRIVLARELSLREMEMIINSSGIEAEAFVHGAHCMSLSGACYLSAMLGGRSGNRGLCAQPCRLDFHAGGKEFALSLKDMSYIDHVAELRDIGVCSFKIEGRMKRPEYVAAAVTACKNALEGKSYDRDTLEAVFSRSGFTDGYLTGDRGQKMFGYRRREDVVAAAGVLGRLAASYRTETPSIPVSMDFSLRKGAAAKLTVSCGENSINVAGAVPEIAIKRETDRDTALKSLSKTGGTPFVITDFNFYSDGGLTLSVSELNAIRRDALQRLLDKRGETVSHEFTERLTGKQDNYTAPEEPEIWARYEHAGQIGEKKPNRVILPLREIRNHPELISGLGEKLTGELPAAAFPEYEDSVGKLCEELRELGLSSLYTDNIYGIYLGNRLGMEVLGGAGLNVMNTQSGEMYSQLGVTAITVSFELSMSAVRKLLGKWRRGLIAYGYLPLMRFRACPGKLAGSCSACGGNMTVTDRKGTQFKLLCSEKRYSTLLNSVPLHIADKSIAPLDFLTLYFTTENRSECDRVIGQYETKTAFAGQRTGGLYYRGVL